MHLKTNRFIADLVFGIILSVLGVSFLFYRKKIISALMASNKVFWERIGFAPDEAKGMFITNIMIPIIGIIFLLVGGVLIYRVIIYFLR